MPAPKSAVSTSPPPVISGSPEPRITFVASRTVLNSLRGMPIMSQMTSSGNGCDSTSTRSTSPFSQKSSITSAQIVSTESSSPCSCPRRERARHDATLAGVARVVHRDERAEELERLGRHVRDRRRPLARAEILRPPADLHHFVVAGHGVELVGHARHRVVRLSSGERADGRAAARTQPCGRRVRVARTPDP